MGEIMGKHEAIEELLEKITDAVDSYPGYATTGIAHFVYNREVAWKKIILSLLNMTYSGPEGIAIPLWLMRDMEPASLATYLDHSAKYMIVKDKRSDDKLTGDLS